MACFGVSLVNVSWKKYSYFLYYQPEYAVVGINFTIKNIISEFFFGLEFYGYGVILFNYCETLKAFITVLTRISFFFYQIYTNIHKIIFFIQLVYKYWILYTSTKTEMYLLPINTNRVYTFHFIHFFFIHSLIVK